MYCKTQCKIRLNQILVFGGFLELKNKQVGLSLFSPDKQKNIFYLLKCESRPPQYYRIIYGPS
jgi:hypothetical protein